MEYEARGDASDVPSWSENGEQLAYVTNRIDPSERHLHVDSIEDDDCDEHTAFTDVRGNAVALTWFCEERTSCARGALLPLTFTSLT